MKDARRHTRNVVDQFFPVMNRDNQELIGYLTDVTVNGGMLESESALPEGEIYPFRIELSEDIGGGRFIDLDARCKWTRKDRNAVFHYSGFEFLELSPGERERIVELAERYRLTMSR